MRERCLPTLVLFCGLVLCACKQPMAAPSAPPPAHAVQVTEEEQPPPRDEFELDEDADDPAAALESMRHNCCDEMPANEIREHVE